MTSGTSGVLIVKLGFDLSPAVKQIDMPEGLGRIHVNHLPQVAHVRGDFVLIRQAEAGKFGIDVIPSADMAAGFKVAATLEKLGSLAISAGICEGYVPRGFHAVVCESLEATLDRAFNECSYGSYVRLDDQSSVVVVSEHAIAEGTLVEAVRGHNSVLVVRPAEFVSEEPYRYDTWAGYVSAILAEEKPRLRGRLVPKKAPKHLFGVWVGRPLDFINRRGQASCVYKVDGRDEGTVADLYFTRVDETPEVPITTGQAVEVWFTGGANVAVVPYTGKVDRIIDPENLVCDLGLKLEGKRLESRDNWRVTKNDPDPEAVKV